MLASLPSVPESPRRRAPDLCAGLVLLSGLILCSVQVTAIESSSLPPLSDMMGQSAEWPCHYAGSFVQERTLTDINSKVVSNGEFLYSCRKGLLWEVRAPIADILVYTTLKRQFRVRKKGRVAELKGIAESRMARLLLSFLGGDTAALEKDFELSVGADGTVVMEPRSTRVQKRLNSIALSRSEQSTRVQIDAPGSGIVTIVISNIVIHDEKVHAACRRFSEQPEAACKVFINPSAFIDSASDQSR